MSNTYREIIVTCSLVQPDGSIVSHAGTLLREQRGSGFVTIRYYDPIENHFYERGGQPLDYPGIFGRFQHIMVHALQGR